MIIYPINVPETEFLQAQAHTATNLTTAVN